MKYQDFELSCQDFERLAAELARERMMDVTLRADGLAHAAVCERCAARLASERALSAGLRALAATATTEAPGRVESALLAAFREQKAAGHPLSAEAAMSAVVVTPTFRRVPVNWRWWAVAAAVLMLCGLAAARLMNHPANPGNQPEVVRHPQPVAPAPEPRPVEPESISTTPDTPEPEVRDHLVAVSNGSRKMRVRPLPRAGAVESRAAKPETDGVEEVYSDFIPLGEGLAQGPMESGHLMRVRMPRSVLPRFGLPVNMERAGESINAEVLMGDDGMARAIRFASQVPKGTLARY